MKEYHLFYAPDLAETSILPPEESTHAVRVLRMKEGDTLRVADGRGTFYDARITEASPRACGVEIIRTYTEHPAHKGRIRLAVAPTKNADRMEWLTEKATESGLDTLHFVICKNSERKVMKRERVWRVAVAAAKQSHKATLPEIEEPVSLADFLKEETLGREGAQRFIAHCLDMTDETDPAYGNPAETKTPHLADVVNTDGDTVILIGPEGDFTSEEVAQAIAAGFRPISLGDCRLRTETAALAAAILMATAKRRSKG